MKARSIARELALITLFQLDRTGKLSTEQPLNEPKEVKAMMLDAVRALADQTKEQLEETAKDLSLIYDFMVQTEQEHPSNLETPVDRPAVPITLPNTQEMAQKVQALLTCADYLGEALHLPELVALSEQTDVQQHALTLLAAVQNHLSELDLLLEDCTEDWKVSRLSKMDRAILRLAAAEMKYCDDVDISTTIDEAIELAKQFSDEESYKFINGVLGGLAKQMDPSTPNTLSIENANILS